MAEQLRFLLPARHRHGDVSVALDDTATLGHLIESVGVPRTEVGEVHRNGEPAPVTQQAADGDIIDVLPVRRPQPVPAYRFVLDVHFGSLARRMRLLGIDTAYRNDADDPELVEQAIAEGRVLLTQDRGLLRRKALPVGAFVCGSGTEEQLRDLLDRFDPPLAPWTRCPACNGELAPVTLAQVEHLLEAGTRRSYTDFAQCADCGRPYWRGAHADRLDAIVTGARAATGPTGTSAGQASVGPPGTPPTGTDE